MIKKLLDCIFRAFESRIESKAKHLLDGHTAKSTINGVKHMDTSAIESAKTSLVNKANALKQELEGFKAMIADARAHIEQAEATYKSVVSTIATTMNSIKSAAAAGEIALPSLPAAPVTPTVEG